MFTFCIQQNKISFTYLLVVIKLHIYLIKQVYEIFSLVIQLYIHLYKILFRRSHCLFSYNLMLLVNGCILKIFPKIFSKQTMMKAQFKIIQKQNQKIYNIKFSNLTKLLTNICVPKALRIFLEHLQEFEKLYSNSQKDLSQ